MPQGLQVFNASGNLILDIGSRPLKLLQVNSLTAGTNVTISTPNTVVPIVVNSGLNYTPIITTTTNSVSVTWRSGTTGTASLLLQEF